MSEKNEGPNPVISFCAGVADLVGLFKFIGANKDITEKILFSDSLGMLEISMDGTLQYLAKMREYFIGIDPKVEQYRTGAYDAAKKEVSKAGEMVPALRHYAKLWYETINVGLSLVNSMGSEAIARRQKPRYTDYPFWTIMDARMFGMFIENIPKREKLIGEIMRKQIKPLRKESDNKVSTTNADADRIANAATNAASIESDRVDKEKELKEDAAEPENGAELLNKKAGEAIEKVSADKEEILKPTKKTVCLFSFSKKETKEDVVMAITEFVSKQEKNFNSTVIVLSEKDYSKFEYAKTEDISKFLGEVIAKYNSHKNAIFISLVDSFDKYFKSKKGAPIDGVEFEIIASHHLLKNPIQKLIDSLTK